MVQTMVQNMQNMVTCSLETVFGANHGKPLQFFSFFIPLKTSGVRRWSSGSMASLLGKNGSFFSCLLFILKCSIATCLQLLVAG